MFSGTKLLTRFKNFLEIFVKFRKGIISVYFAIHVWFYF